MVLRVCGIEGLSLFVRGGATSSFRGHENDYHQTCLCTNVDQLLETFTTAVVASGVCGSCSEQLEPIRAGSVFLELMYP